MDGVSAGLVNAALNAVRTEAMRTTGLEMAGQSTTVVPAVALGDTADPAIKLPVAIVLQWLQIARVQAEATPGLDSMWRLAVQSAKNKKERKWQAVRGPMGATIATLLDAEWEPEGWNKWIDAYGQMWSLTDCPEKEINMRTCDGMLRVFPP